MNKACPFCDVTESVIENRFALAVFDTYPVSPGHLLIVPKRHIAEYFELSTEEKHDMWSLVDLGKDFLNAQHSPGGYNIGINCGNVAGQTVMHAHIHLIPRYIGDVTDPRGGVRGVIPEKQKYSAS